MSPAPAPAATLCPLCQGTGWRLIAGAEGSEHAQRCECRMEERARALWDEAGIPKRYHQCHFDTFRCEPGSPLEAALLVARGFAESYPAESRRSGLLILGPVGVGKTHLAVAIAQYLIECKGIACRFTDYRELLKRIQATFDPANPGTEAGVVAPLLETEVLILDDVGVGRASDWALETLHYLLNHRYSQERTTLLTSNFEEPDPTRPGLPSLKDAVGERLYSRLFEMCRLVAIQGPDFRQQLARERRLR